MTRLVGTVILQVVVGPDGKARDFQILRTLGLGLDETAITAVSAWRFGPSLKDGQAVNVRAQIEVNFSILDKDSRVRSHLAGIEFHLVQDSTRPVIEKVAAPHTADSADSATATLTFDVDEKGNPANLHIGASSNEEWAGDVTEAVRKWKFTPGSQNGSPVSVPCTMDFVRGN